MAISGATTPATLANGIDSEKILRDKVLQQQTAPYLAKLLAWNYDASSAGSATITVIKENSHTAGYQEGGTTYTQTDTIAATATTFTQVQVSAVTCPHRSALSEDGAQDFEGAVTIMLRQHYRAIMNQVDTDFLSRLAEGTATEGDFSGNGATLDSWLIAQGAHRENNPVLDQGQKVAFAAHDHQHTDLLRDIAFNGGTIFGGDKYSQMFAELADAESLGYRGKFNGVEMFSSTLIPEADSTNWSGGFLTIGEQGSIMLATWRPFMTRSQVEIVTDSVDYVSKIRYGSALTDDANVMPYITSKS